MTDSTPTTAAGWTRNAIHEINGGEISDAREMLAAAIRLDPTYETAWIWFASVATDDAERRYCYERAVEINPTSVVAEPLARLRTTESTPPVELQDFEAPPLPEEFGGTQLAEEPGRPWKPLALIAAIVLGVIVAGFWLLWPKSGPQGTPIYIALATGMTGTAPQSALQMQRGLQIYVDYVNSNGGIEGRPVQVVTFDDADDVDQAVEVAHQIVDDGRFVAVVGHRLSSTSIAAAPIYQQAGIPMISPTATADSLTVDCDWCFRTVFDNKNQGEMIASYMRGVLDVDRVVVISEESVYGSTLANGFSTLFEQAGGQVEEEYVLPADPAQAGDTIQQTAEAIARDHPDTLIFIPMGSELAQSVVISLRKAGIESTIFGGDSIGSPVFLETVNEAAGVDDANSPTIGLYASSPVFTDSLTGEAVRLASKFTEVYGDDPTWRSMTSADAGVAVIHGLESIGSEIDDTSIEQQRVDIRASWLAMNSPATSIQAFVGPLYFDANRTASRPVAIGVSSGELYNSAPRQLVPLTDQLRASNPDIPTITVGDSSFGVKRVVLTGVDFNLIRDLDTVSQTFFADFFMWFKYYGDDDAVNINLSNVSDPQLLTITEIRSSEIDGMKYKVYRITGSFTSQLDFRSFPFDTQNLQVLVQNQTATQKELVYAMDSDFLEIPDADRIQSGSNATTSINHINNWKADSLDAYAGAVGTTSSLGDPAVESATEGVEFSQVGVSIKISRNVGQFLLKNLLPLILLLAITYISLFFSHEQTTERVSFGITGVLTGAVLLSSVVAVLPDVGYTVAIEWAFYGFILLSALCVLVALIGGRLNEAKQLSEMRTLDLASRIGYPVLVAAAFLGYWLVYA